jgi:hypothetical protein
MKKTATLGRLLEWYSTVGCATRKKQKCLKQKMLALDNRTAETVKTVISKFQCLLYLFF